MNYRAGYVGLIGLPNAGKSTLLNALVGEKVAIVTPKPQTTRQRIVGMVNREKSQICFADAPGLIRSEKGLNKFLAQEFTDVIKDSDVLVAVLGIDEAKLENLLDVTEVIKASGKPWVIVLNKTDIPKLHRVLILREKLKEYGVPIISGSAEKEPAELCQELLPILELKLPESPGPLYDKDMYTTHSSRDMASELIREQCFLNLHEELPFSMAIRIRSYDETSPTLVRIMADVVVSKESHRRMVIGTGGLRLKEIGQGARLEIEKLVGRKVFLGLHVVTRPKWNEQPSWLKEFGYGLNPS